jgi:hypothetical protein
MNNMVIIVMALLLVGGIVFLARKVQQDKERLEFLINGTQFEANIVGVSHPDETPSNDTRGRIKVKISYDHPFTRKEVTVHRMLDRRDYRDKRLISAGNPDLTTKDAEGYSKLTPPVLAEGYLLNCEVMFVQKARSSKVEVSI